MQYDQLIKIIINNLQDKHIMGNTSLSNTVITLNNKSHKQTAIDYSTSLAAKAVNKTSGNNTKSDSKITQDKFAKTNNPETTNAKNMGGAFSQMKPELTSPMMLVLNSPYSSVLNDPQTLSHLLKVTHDSNMTEKNKLKSIAKHLAKEFCKISDKNSLKGTRALKNPATIKSALLASSYATSLNSGDRSTYSANNNRYATSAYNQMFGGSDSTNPNIFGFLAKLGKNVNVFVMGVLVAMMLMDSTQNQLNSMYKGATSLINDGNKITDASNLESEIEEAIAKYEESTDKGGAGGSDSSHIQDLIDAFYKKDANNNFANPDLRTALTPVLKSLGYTQDEIDGTNPKDLVTSQNFSVKWTEAFTDAGNSYNNIVGQDSGSKVDNFSGFDFDKGTLAGFKTICANNSSLFSQAETQSNNLNQKTNLEIQTVTSFFNQFLNMGESNISANQSANQALAKF